MKNTKTNYTKALEDASQIKGKEMRERYVKGVKSLWASDTLKEDLKVRASSTSLYQALFYEEMMEEYGEEIK